MTAFKRFRPEDQLDNVIVVEPRWTLVSGSNGWRGSPEGSSSLNLYGGHVRTGIVRSWRYDRMLAQQVHLGAIERTTLTASVNVVWMTNETLPLGQVTDTRWGKEHWDVVQRLYNDYYAYDPDFITGSYDYYCLYFSSSSLNIVVDDVQNGTAPLTPSGSFTIESWIKPFVTSSAFGDFTVQSWNRSFWFGLTGSTGRLMFSSSLGQSATASIDVAIRRWNHVAFSYDSSTKTGSFYVNGTVAGTFLSPSASITAGTPSAGAPGRGPYYTIGNQLDDSADAIAFTSAGGIVARARRGFHGFIGESRYWEAARTSQQLSGTAYGRLTGSNAAGPLAYLKFNEGPLSSVASFALGSASVDYAGVARGRTVYDRARFTGFSDRVGPVWHPNDNVAFYPTKELAPSFLTGSWGRTASENVTRMLVVDVPSAFYGRRIVPGTVSLACWNFSTADSGLVRTLVDDGRGGLFISGSACSSSIATREDYRGVEWNKVGNVFYSDGLMIIKDPSLLDFGRTDGASSAATDTFQISFKGDNRVPVKTLLCRLDKGEFNCSTNPTFSSVDDDGRRIRTNASGSIWISTVGVYDKSRKLVGVARLAQPIRKRPEDRITIKLRMDY